MAKPTFTDMLEKTHELILEGWVKGYPHRYNSWGGESYCVVGAIAEARRVLGGTPALDYNVMSYLNDVLYEKTNGVCRNVMTYNDSPGSSLKDISDLLMDAIEELHEDTLASV